jgi:hypothetical protein
MNNQCSANITPSAAGWNNDKGKQEEECIADTQTRPPNDPTRPTEFNNNGNRALRKLLMSTRWKDTKKATAKIPCDLSPEVVEICTARGFKVNFSFIMSARLALLETGTAENYRAQAET